MLGRSRRVLGSGPRSEGLPGGVRTLRCRDEAKRSRWSCAEEEMDRKTMEKLWKTMENDGKTI